MGVLQLLREWKVKTNGYVTVHGLHSWEVHGIETRKESGHEAYPATKPIYQGPGVYWHGQTPTSYLLKEYAIFAGCIICSRSQRTTIFMPSQSAATMPRSRITIAQTRSTTTARHTAMSCACSCRTPSSVS